MPSFITVVGAGLCMVPVSVDWSNREGSLAVVIQTANVAELAASPYEAASWL